MRIMCGFCKCTAVSQHSMVLVSIDFGSLFKRQMRFGSKQRKVLCQIEHPMPHTKAKARGSVPSCEAAIDLATS